LLLATFTSGTTGEAERSLADEEDHHQDSEELLKQCEENASKASTRVKKSPLCIKVK